MLPQTYQSFLAACGHLAMPLPLNRCLLVILLTASLVFILLILFYFVYSIWIRVSFFYCNRTVEYMFSFIITNDNLSIGTHQRTKTVHKHARNLFDRSLTCDRKRHLWEITWLGKPKIVVGFPCSVGHFN